MTVLTVSDTHSGSTLALLPPNFVTLEGNPVGRNLIQEWLWSCWTSMLAQLPEKLDIVVFNGDLIEGNHHGSRQTVTNDDGDHIKAALEVLSPLAARATRRYVTLGTECHTHNLEHVIARKLRATPPNDHQHAHESLLLNIEGHLCSFRHHCSATSRVWLESGEYSRAIASEQLECTRAGWGCPTYFGRAHRHRGGMFSDFHSTMIVTGGWQ